MQQFRILMLALGAFWLASAPALALDATQPVSHGARHAPPVKAAPVIGHYIDIAALPALPKPLLPHSRAGKAEVRQVIGAQTYAAPDEVATARDEQTLRPELLTHLLGPTVTRASHPKLFTLLDKAGADAALAVDRAKRHWHTLRPYRRDKRVRLQVDPLPQDNYAYPSGHAATALVWAEILARVYPGFAPNFMHQADRIAWRRVVAGVHVPNDLDGGRILGAAIAAALKTSPAFNADLAAARAERAASCAPSPKPARKNWKSFKSRITE